MSAPVLELRDVAFAYGGSPFSLRVPHLRLDPGERVALVGPSGSGKTTLLHLMAGILQPDRGSVRLAGDELAGLADARRRALRVARIGLVFQEFELLEYLSALDNVLLPLHLAGGPDAERLARAHELARRSGISHTLERPPARLSQGERQRVALCRALVTDPPLVLADEPTGNLDPASAAQALDLLFEATAERRTALLVVTHDHGLLDRFERVLDLADLVGAPAASATADGAGPPEDRS